MLKDLAQTLPILLLDLIPIVACILLFLVLCFTFKAYVRLKEARRSLWALESNLHKLLFALAEQVKQHKEPEVNRYRAALQEIAPDSFDCSPRIRVIVRKALYE